MKRRTFIGTAIAVAVAGAIAAKPSRNGGPYNDYFASLNKELQRQRLFKPTLIVDLDLVDKNIAEMKSMFNGNAGHRIPVKSLPSIDFVDYFMRQSGTKRLMVFHTPFLHMLAKSFPDSDLLFGKPMPVGAAQNYYENIDPETNFDSSTQLQWLIDTHERLEQYLALAKQVNQKMRINIEIDVGLHRGGLSDTQELVRLLDTISDNAQYLEFSGFMGYDPHVVKLPSIVKSKEDAYAESQEVYQAFLDAALAHKLNLKAEDLCLNGSGSPTLAMHKDKTVCNDLTAGSCIVKPTSFDLVTLETMVPASFIATPVLKKSKGVNVPGINNISGLISAWDPNREQSFYMYGGKWDASFVSPPGLVDNATIGFSTNQQIVNGSKEVELEADDFVFLRPYQSEFVFLQFGNIRTVRDGKLTDNVWEIFPNEVV